MGVYIRIFKNTLDIYSIYRLNFILWRVRVVINMLIPYFLWGSVLSHTSSIFGYDQRQMLTYIIFSAIITSIVQSTQTGRVGEEITSGELTNFLLRPIHYFSFLIARDLSDKFFNIVFAIFEVIGVVIILQTPLFIQGHIWILASVFLLVFLATVVYFIIGVLLGFFGFWTAEVWGPRFIFFILVSFLSGSLFPLDIFPKWFFQFLMMTPFPYLTFFPLKVYLGQLSTTEIIQGMVTLSAWGVILWGALIITWRRGLAHYQAEGR